MYTIEQLQAQVNETISKYDIGFKVPVRVNGRLTRTLGRANYSVYAHSRELAFVTNIEFSRNALEMICDEDVRQILLHECAHIITAATSHDGIDHGHDRVFKKICAEIGCVNDQASFSPRYRDLSGFKFHIMCPKCGMIDATNRKTAIVKNPSRYRCTACHSTLYVE